MRIVLDFTAVGSRGTSVYARGFLTALAALPVEDEIVVLVAPGLASWVALPPGHPCRVVEVGMARDTARRVMWELFALGPTLRRLGADVVFAPFGIAPVFSPCPVLLAIRDPSPHIGSDYRYRARTRAGNLIRRLVVRMACRVASGVLFPSHDAARRLGDSLGISGDKRIVVYHGVDHALWTTSQDTSGVLGRYGLSGVPYVLFVSQLYRQKHPEILVEGFARWITRHSHLRHRLVFAGKEEEPQFAAALRTLVRGHGIESRTLFLGLVPHGDLPALYRGADLFVLPTSMETFGHPFVEAMATGTPVACADIPVAREICGEAALYFPPGDAGALSQILTDVVLGPSGYRAEMSRKGRARAVEFSWEREACETLTALREMAGKGRAVTGALR